MPRDPAKHPLDDRVRLQHMLEAARQATTFVDGRQRSDLDTDPMLLRALCHALQEIGEATAHTSELGRARVPGIPWAQIVAMRNVMVHVYWGIDRNRVWKAATEDLPILIAALERAFENWPLPPSSNS